MLNWYHPGLLTYLHSVVVVGAQQWQDDRVKVVLDILIVNSHAHCIFFVLGQSSLGQLSQTSLGWLRLGAADATHGLETAEVLSRASNADIIGYDSK
jgi:hypothetical protein